MRKVCAKMVPKNLTTEQKANRRNACLDLLDRLEREPEFFSRIIQVLMNHGFWSTTPRQNAKVESGTLQILPVPRKREWANPKSNRCSFVFMTVRGSSTRNLCHQDKLSIKLFIGKSLKDSRKGWHVCDQALGAAPRQRPMSHGSLHQLIFDRKMHSCISSASLLVGSQSLWLLFIPPAQKPLESALFCTFNNIQKSVTEELKGKPA